MGRLYSDTEKLLMARDLESRGHHSAAAKKYQDMGNERRSANQKRQLWSAAAKARRKL